MSRLLLFIVLGGFLMYGITNLSLNDSVSRGTENSVTSFSYNQARNIANSTVQMVLSRLGDDIDWRVTSPATIDLYGGYATYTVTSVTQTSGDDDDDHDGDDDDDDHDGDDDDDDDDHGGGKEKKSTFNDFQEVLDRDYTTNDDNDVASHIDNGTLNASVPIDMSNMGIASLNNLVLNFFKEESFTFTKKGDDDDDHEGDDDDDDHDGDDDDDHDSDDDDDGHEGDDDDDGGGISSENLYKEIKIAVTAYYNGVTKSITVYAKGFDVSSINLPVSVKAAITTNNDVETLGSLTVDGRDHNSSGSLISGSGKYGIWTTSSLNQSGASKIGGTNNSTDYAPSKPGNSLIIKEDQTWSGGYPATPDEVLGGSSLGYSEGTLKDVAVRGVKGSQYVTDPSELTYPLKGVTYVELPSGGIWNSADIDGEGILIVHNSSKDALIKNLNHSTFKGLVIADDVVHIHNDIVGAVFVLTENPSGGNCIGNGNGNVLYSSETLKGVYAEVEQIIKTNYGFSNPRLMITSWLE